MCLLVFPAQNFGLVQFDPNLLGPGRLDELIDEVTLSEEKLEVVRVSL